MVHLKVGSERFLFVPLLGLAMIAISTDISHPLFTLKNNYQKTVHMLLWICNIQLREQLWFSPRLDLNDLLYVIFPLPRLAMIDFSIDMYHSLFTLKTNWLSTKTWSVEGRPFNQDNSCGSAWGGFWNIFICVTFLCQNQLWQQFQLTCTTLYLHQNKSIIQNQFTQPFESMLIN